MIRSAVVLCGGSGTRMWPFAEVRNKCAVPVANVPNVRRIVDQLDEIGIVRVCVVVGENAGSIRHSLLGCTSEPLIVEQPPDGGTAGAALAGLRAVDDDQLLIVLGDVATTAANLRKVAETPARTDAAGAALVSPVRPDLSGEWYGAAIEEGRLARVIGHETGMDRRLAGVFAVRDDLIPVLEANPGRMCSVAVGGMPPLEPDLMQSLNDWGADIVAVEASEFVVDMDKPWHVLEANARVAEYDTARLTQNVIAEDARIDDSAEIDGFVRLGAGSVIGKRVVIEGNLVVDSGTSILNGAILRGANVVGARTRISDYCLIDRRTVVGSDCVVGHGAEMDGVVMDGAYLYHYCEISGLVGASVDIGAATVCGTLRFDDRDAEHRVKGRRERPPIEANASYFGDHSRTGVNVITNPGAKIGAYACVGPGIVVTGDLPNNTLTLLKQDTVVRPWGPERYGW